MTKEEAIEKVRFDLLGRAFFDPTTREAYDMLIPELKESPDEIVRKQLMDTVRRAAGDGGVHISEELERRYLNYLERVKDETLKEEDIPILASCIEEVRRYRDEWGDFNSSEAFAREVIKRYKLRKWSPTK